MGINDHYDQRESIFDISQRREAERNAKAIKHRHHLGLPCDCGAVDASLQASRPLGPELPEFGRETALPPEPIALPMMQQVVTPPEWGAILDSIAFKGMLFVCFENVGVCVMTKEGAFVKLVPEGVTWPK